MRQNIGINMSQQLGMTPQLAQSIRLLQLSSLELSAELNQALDDNLMLERDEDDVEVRAADDLAEDQRMDLHGGMRTVGDDDDDSASRQAAVTQDVHMRILEQAAMVFANETDRLIVCEICAATDDAGYLGADVDELNDRLQGIPGISAERIARVLHGVQRLEPVGYAARSLSEALHVQLEERQQDGQGDAYLLRLALTLVDGCLDDVAAKRWTALASRLKVSVDDVLAAVGIVRGLNPKPAAQHADTQYVTPDVRVEPSERGYTVRLNDHALPRLRVNSDYARAVEGDRNARALKDQLQEARWLLRSVQVRQDTLLAAAEAIFRRQSAFLTRGEVGLSPLTLKDIADEIGVHESTLSRITTSKYVETPRGIYSLKHFFPSQLTAAEGVSASGASVKALIKRLIDAEPGDEPLRDVDITAILARRGISIARRTIAKYREAMGIGSSKERQAARRMLARSSTGRSGPVSGNAAAHAAV
ncbi:MAG: RNA polymerase factor sigma-54 [Oceanococcaceae bacterium]